MLLRMMGVAVIIAIMAQGCGVSESSERFVVYLGEEAGVVQLEDVTTAVPFAQDAANSTTTAGMGLHFLASVRAPELDNEVLAATDVQWIGDRIYASYAATGPDPAGALQIIDVSSRYVPRVIETTFFPQTRIRRIVVHNQRVYAAGSDATYGATLESFRTTGDALVPLGFEVFPGIATTYVSVHQNRLFVSRRGGGGGVSVLQINGDQLTPVATLAAVNPRWVDGYGNRGAVVVSGNPGTLTHHRNISAPAAGVRVANFDGASIGLPTWATRNEDWLFISADEAGLIVYELNGMRLMAELPLPGDANGSALFNNNELLFLAQGEGGLMVADVSAPQRPVFLASIDVDDSGSANAVAVDGDYAALADGTGGVKIVRYNLDLECFVLNFDTDAAGATIETGAVLHDAYSALGVDISVLDKHGNPGLAVAFDSNNPTGGDDDLSYQEQGHILISQENFCDTDVANGRVDEPDDNARGGTFEFSFARPVCVTAVTALDIDTGESATVSQYQGDSVLTTQEVAGAGNNGRQDVPVSPTGSCATTRLALTLSGSGAFDDVAFCAY